jgi:nicotinamidase-related amidase
MATSNHTSHAELPVPAFYDPENAAKWDYRPDQQALFEFALQWRQRYDLRPAAADPTTVHLLLVDLQKDFCFPEGALYVGGRSGRGAIEDNDRIARFIYRNLAVLTDITCTMDTHIPYQIFSPAFWLDENDLPPPAHREVTLSDIRNGRLRPNPALAPSLSRGDPAWLQRQVEFYARELEKTGKYTLYLWPPHCILGSDGHALAGVIHEARMFHAYARLARSWVELKGTTPLTEYYSVLAPEVMTGHDGTRLARRNDDFLAILEASDIVIIAGQAASHCVKSTIEDLLSQLDQSLVTKIYILRDCMSAVAVPNPTRAGAFLADFTPQAEAALRRFSDAGMHVVESTQAIDDWPGVKELRVAALEVGASHTKG